MKTSSTTNRWKRWSKNSMKAVQTSLWEYLTILSTGDAATRCEMCIRDRDVGHQAYGHKILTGRREAFSTNRKLGGIRPFPSPEESEYDTFTCGHASNSISDVYKRQGHNGAIEMKAFQDIPACRSSLRNETFFLVRIFYYIRGVCRFHRYRMKQHGKHYYYIIF